MSDNKDNVLHYLYFVKKKSLHLTEVKFNEQTVPLGKGHTFAACVIAHKRVRGILRLYVQHT